MKKFKYLCLALALSSLVAALFPTCVVAPQACRAGGIAPWWIGRAVYFTDFLLASLALYGIQVKTRIYWKVIPLLVVIFVLTVIGPLVWNAIELSFPWEPVALVMIVAAGATMIFIVWWQNQKGYFLR